MGFRDRSTQVGLEAEPRPRSPLIAQQLSINKGGIVTYHGIKNQVYAVCSSSKLDTGNLIMTIGGWVWGYGKKLLEFVQKNLCPPVATPLSMPQTSSVRSVVSIQYRLVTDRQTDRQTHDDDIPR